ncbi:MAG: hypothetical protein WBD20_01710 [Pirellulaceae bacterium]
MRYIAKQRDYELVHDATFIATATEKLAADGYRLTPVPDPQQCAKFVQLEIECLQSKIDSLNTHLPGLSIKDGNATILVSDLDFSQVKQISSRLDAAVRWGNLTFKCPNHFYPLGKPIVIVLSSQARLKQFQIQKVRDELIQSLADSGVKAIPIVFVESGSPSGTNLAEILFQRVMLEFASEIYSDKPLPAWLQVGMAMTCRRSEFGGQTRVADKLETTRRLKLKGTLKKTIDTNDLGQVDELIALAMVNQLIWKDPQAYNQLLKDLKHGESLTSGLQTNFNFDSPYLMYLVGQCHGVDVRRDF